MIRLLLPALLVLAAAPACKKTEDLKAQAMAKMAEAMDKMCACKDHACAQKVQEEMTRWAQDIARRAGDRRPEPMSEEDQQRYTATTMQMAECAQKAYSPELTRPDAGVPRVDAAPPVEQADAAPPVEKITNADRLIKLTFDSLGDLALKKLVISYVRADGTIDDTYGTADVELGIPKPPDPADDPDRPIGAPVPAARPAYDGVQRCPSFAWRRGVRNEDTTSCLMLDAGLARPKCSVVEVWKRAIDKGAPEKALAVLELRGPPDQSWKLRIDDAPRGIHFAIDVPDTCAPTLEAPR